MPARAEATHSFACFDQVRLAHAAELRIVADEVGELAALLDQVAARKSRDAFLVAVNPDKLAQHQPGVIEAQSLIEVRSQQVMAATEVLQFAELHRALP